MQYRRLRQAELDDLEQAFIRFLATNSITGQEWVRIKGQQPERAEELIGLFSDLVFERVLKDIQYLEFKTSKDIKAFHCLESQIILNGLLVEGDTSFDFTLEQSPQQMFQQIQRSGAKLKLYTAEKTYSRGRELELFEMMENGALISRDGALFKTLEALKKP